MKRSSERNLLIGLLLLVGGIAIGLLFSWLSARQLKNTTFWVSHANNVLYHSEKLLSVTVDNETAIRSFVLTGKEEFLEPFDNSSRVIRENMQSLRLLVKDTKSQQLLLDSVEKVVNARLIFSDSELNKIKSLGYKPGENLAYEVRGRILTDSVRYFISRFQLQEQLLLMQRSALIEKKWSKVNLAIRLLGFLLLILTFIVAYQLWKYITRRRKHLKDLEQEKLALTEEVAIKTNELNTAFDRISDAFISLNTHWEYTFVNKKAGELSGRNPADLVGKNIWKEFPEAHGLPFHQACEKAFEEQQYTYLQEFYPPLGCWFENHIYPSVDGVSVFYRDITEKEKAEQAIKRNEERYNLAIMATRDGIWDWNIETGEEYFSPRWYEMSGFDPKEAGLPLTYNEWTKRIHPDHYHYVIKKMNDHLYNKTPFEVEYLQLHRSGEYRWQKLIGQAVFNEAGRAIRMVASISDITEQKKADQQIKESEERYRNLIEQASDSIFVALNNGDFTEVNTSAEKLTGYTKRELARMNVRDLLCQEDMLKAPLRFEELETEKVVRSERRFVRKDRTLIYAEVSFKLLSNGCILGMARDITERTKTEKKLRDSEEKYRTLIERVSDGFIALDKSWCYTYANKQIGEIVQRDPASLIGKNVWEEFPEAVGSGTYLAFKKAMEEQRYVHNVDYYEPLDLWQENHIYPSPDGISVFVRDITEAKRTEHELSSYKEAIDQSSIVSVTDKEGKIQHVNENFCRTSKYTEEELIGKDHSLLKSGYHSAAFIQNLWDTITRGEIWRGEICNKAKDGSRYWVDTTIIPFLGANGKPYRYMAIRSDITERKIAEAASQKEKELSDSIINSLPGIFFIYDDQGRLIRWNKNFESVTGYGSHELQQMVPLDFFDTAEHDLVEKKTGEVVEKGTAEMEGHLLTKDRQKIPYYFNGWRVKVEEKIWIIGVGIDISKMREAEKVSQQSQETQRLIMQSAMDGIVCMNKEGQVTVWTSRAEKIFGWAEGEIMGKRIADTIIPAAYSKRHTEGLKQFIETGEGPLIGTPIEVTALKKGGDEFPVEMMVVPLQQNNNLFFCAFIRDITERKKSEEQLLSANERFNLIARATNDFVWDAYLTENKVWWNDNYYNQLGWRKGENIPGGETWEDHIHPQDKKRVLNSIAEALANPQKNTWTDEYRFERSDGSYISVLDRGYIMRNEKGEAFRMIGAMTDISAIKQAEEEARSSEEKYRLLFNRNPLPMWVLDMENLNFLAVNEAAISHYGYTAEEFRGMNALHIHIKDEHSKFLKSVARSKTELHNKGVWKHLKKNGEIIDVEIYAYPIIYEGRRAELKLVNDVTEKLKSETLLKRSYDDIRMLATRQEQVREEERIRIAREIHDELGQQLTVLKMGVSWLIRKIDNPDEKVKEKLKDILDMINSTVKSVRRISSDLRPSILDNLGLAAALEWEAGEFEKRSGIKTQLQIGARDVHLPGSIATAFFRVFQESLTNIARHAEASKVDVALRNDNGDLCLIIKDNGKGFEVKNVESKKTLGILGMRERVAIINGAYEIESRAGAGTITRVNVHIDNQH